MRSRAQASGASDMARPDVATSVLIGAIRELASARSIDAIAGIVRSAARRLVGAEGATFVLRDQEQCLYLDEDAISPLWKGQRFPLTSCVSGWAMLHQQQVVIRDIYVDPRIPHDAYRPTFVKSLVMTPVRRAPAFAAIGTYWASQREATASECAFLQDLADATAVAMENAEVYRELELRVAQRTEELVALNRELEAFSYSVAHDLRSPLAAIMGFAQLLDRRFAQSVGVEAQSMIQEIGAASERMNELIVGLLDFARCSRSTLHRERVDLSALAEKLVQQISREAGYVGRVDVEPGIVVEGDARMLGVVLTNLLSNAFKYSSRVSAPQVSIGARREDERVVVFVRDNGAGFDAAAAEKLFVPFHRLHDDTQFAGHGVGLATVARIVRRHGGEVWAESTVGNGATFSFSLPVSSAH